MFNEYKQLYMESANLLGDWKKIDKNELCRQYINLKDTELGNAYMSAIICSFWYILNSKIASCKNKYISAEDIYDLYIESIMKALNDHAWTNESSSIYNKDKGPEMAINTVFNCTVVNFFVASTRQKRKLYYETSSLDTEIIENLQDNSITQQDTNVINDMIRTFFINKDYIKSFVLDIIINNEVFELDEDNYLIFNKKKLKHHLVTMDNNYCNYFSGLYGIDINEVYQGKKYIDLIPDTKVYAKIDKILRELKRTKEFTELLNK